MTRVVLITGGAGGIGKAVAAHFRTAGDDVIITGRDTDRLATTAADIDVTAIMCDATDPTQVAALAAAIEHVDVLINAAGGNTDFDREKPADLAEVAAAWQANLNANLLSAVLTTTALQPKLRQGGTIVNIGSIGAEYASTSYGAAKAALAAWTAGMSQEIGPAGVTTNLISPGYVEETDFFRGRMSEQRRATLINATHTGRAGQPNDIAETAYWLASKGARHITGQTIHVNGGAHTTR